MEQLIQFTKIEAAGNDFIVIDKTGIGEEKFTSTHIRQLCHRRRSVGADGLILMDGLRMQYYNADGSSGAMCGNGLRSAVLFAYVQGLIPRATEVSIQADDGNHLTWIQNPQDITVEIKYESDSYTKPSLGNRLPEGVSVLGFYNTGVPHLVLSVSDDLNDVDVSGIGKKLRFDSTFYPDGTNVNFISVSEDGAVQLRTYERGVEDETLACGTGAVASALATTNGYINEGTKVQVQALGGLLTISRNQGKLYLNGAANISFVGQITI